MHLIVYHTRELLLNEKRNGQGTEMRARSRVTLQSYAMFVLVLQMIGLNIVG